MDGLRKITNLRLLRLIRGNSARHLNFISDIPIVSLPPLLTTLSADGPMIRCSILLFCASSFLNGATVANGSFETGDLTGWTHGGYVDWHYPPAVRTSGHRPTFADFFTTQPTEGGQVFSHVFDSDGLADPWLGQAIGIVNAGEILRFDYRLGWAYMRPASASLNRAFLVRLLDADTGDLLESEIVFNATQTQMLDTGPRTHGLDLTPHAGRNARVEFVLQVPERFSGPGHFQLDNVRIIPEAGTSVFLIIGSVCLSCRRTRSRTSRNESVDRY